MISLSQLLAPRDLKGDFLGGLTTAIISLPLALAFGVASGAGAEAGLYGAVLVGFWAAFFGGSNTLISEPTGPMTLMITTVMTSVAATHPESALAVGFTVVVVAGLFQILFGLLKLGRYITIMPYSVVSGFMSGIGVLLVILQLAPLLGHSVPAGGAPGVIDALPTMLNDVHVPGLILGIAALITLFMFPKKWRRYVPPQLIVLIAGTLFTAFFLSNSDLRTIGKISAALPSIHFPVLTFDLLGDILVDGLLLAMLGCIDTLLTATIADSLTRSQHKSNRELVGQGIANVFSGLFGGLPGAGATMGTVVNIQSGGVTPRSGIFRSLILVVFIFVAAPVMSYVPMVVLAAITLKVGVDILDWSFIRRAHKASYLSSAIMYGVLILTVMVDLMVAVGVGVFIANLITIDRLSRIQSGNIKTVDTSSDVHVPMSKQERELFDRGKNQIVMFHLSGPMIFGVASAMAREHKAIRDAQVLIVDLSDVPFLSVTVGLSIENIIRDAQESGCSVIICGASHKVKSRLTGLGMIGPRAKAYTDTTRKHALERALTLINDVPPDAKQRLG